MKYIIVLSACLLVCGCTGQQQVSTVVLEPPVATDTRSSTTLHLDDSSQILTAQSRDGKILWSVDVIKECGVPDVGEPKVRNVTIQDGKASVVFGKHDHAVVNLESGVIESHGAD